MHRALLVPCAMWLAAGVVLWIGGAGQGCTNPPGHGRDVPQRTATPDAGPLEIKQPDHDFGIIWGTQPLRHVFEVKNISTETAWVVPIRMGGTRRRVPVEIRSQETIRIPVTLDPTRLNGRFSTSIKLEVVPPPDE